LTALTIYHVTFTLPQGSYRFRADFDNVQFWSDTQNDCTLPGCTSASVTLPGGMGETTTTIDYTYDPLYRLTAADYSMGDTYRYAYDAVGNRLQQQTSVNGQQSTVGYQYDIANRLTNVGGVDYTWDANGNLLNDGASTYTYDPANRMSSVTQGNNSYTYNYSGLGDRLQQTVNGQRTDSAPQLFMLRACQTLQRFLYCRRTIRLA
jgi:YD repeat-containing protein